MHFAVPGAVAHVYHIQRVLTQLGEDMAYLSTPFHQEIVYWQALVKQTVAQTTHLAVIFCQEPNHMGFCYTSGIVVGDIWLEPTKYGASILWIHPCPSDIAYTLLSYTNPGGVLAKSDIKLS